MATPKIIADFETQLASTISVGSTSFTLASATDDDGVALPAGKYFFTINNASTQKEYVVGTLSGTSVTSVSNVSRQGVQTSGTARAHRIGSSVIMTDFLTYKNYIDETTTAGAPDASTITKGVVEEATQSEINADTAVGGTTARLFVNPSTLATSKYGTQLPSSAEKTFLTAIEQGTLTPQIVTFTSSGTWTKDTGLKYVVVEVQGAGANGTTDGAGGGGGAYSRKIFVASALGATETVTVGTGGVGSGNTSFGSLLVAPNAVGTTGATASGGDINVSGESAVSGQGSAGGNSFLGKGGYGRYQSSSTAVQGGNNGFGFGGGGQGGQPASDGSPTGGTGGTGAPGVVIVTEYYS